MFYVARVKSNFLIHCTHQCSRTLGTQIVSLFESTGTCAPVLKMAEMSKQEGVNDCGVFAIATATSFAFGSDPVNIQQSCMREHLLNCFEKGTMSPFPLL